MQINLSSILNHRYAGQVTGQFSNGYYPRAADPIGESLNSEVVKTKAAKWQSTLDGVDLRNITAKELAELGAALYSAGEISDNAATFMTIADGNQYARDTKFDAIAYFESGFQFTNGNRSVPGAMPLYSDALNTLYNIDRVIHASSINTQA